MVIFVVDVVINIVVIIIIIIIILLLWLLLSSFAGVEIQTAIEGKRQLAVKLIENNADKIVFDVSCLGTELWLPSNLWYRAQQIPKLKCFSFLLAVVFAQSIEASC